MYDINFSDNLVLFNMLVSYILHSLLYKQYEHYEKRGDFFYPIINNALEKIESRKILGVVLGCKRTLKKRESFLLSIIILNKLCYENSLYTEKKIC